MDTGNTKTTFHDDMIAKNRIQQLVGKFPSYPCIAERHPQKIEDFITAYNQALAEVKAAVS